MGNATHYIGVFTLQVSYQVSFSVIPQSLPRLKSHIVQPHNNTIYCTSDRLTPIYGENVRVRVAPPVGEVDGLATRAEYRKGLPGDNASVRRNEAWGDVTYQDEDDDLTPTIQSGRKEVVVLLEPARAMRAQPPLANEANHKARPGRHKSVSKIPLFLSDAYIPPLPVDRVRQVADVEHENRRVDVAPELIEERALLRVAVQQPEGDGEEQSDEYRKGEEVVPLVICE